MAEIPHTLVIGDQIADQLYLAFQQIPGTGAFWEDIMPGWLHGFAQTNELKSTWAKIADGYGAPNKPDRMPDTAIVSLGRFDILNAPKTTDADTLKTIAADTAGVIGKIKELGISSIVWFLPPAIKNEGPIRATIARAASENGARVIDGAERWSDPTVPGDPPTKLSDDTVRQMAGLLAGRIPLGNYAASQWADATLTASGTATQDQAHPTTFLGRLSGPTKIALGGGALFAIGAAVYAARGRRG